MNKPNSDYVEFYPFPLSQNPRQRVFSEVILKAVERHIVPGMTIVAINVRPYSSSSDALRRLAAKYGTILTIQDAGTEA